MKKIIFICWACTFLMLPNSYAQKFERKDSLRGSITTERAWWDLLHYDINVTIDIENKSVSGENIIRYKVIQSQEELQIDLQDPMKIISIEQDRAILTYRKEYSAHFITLNQKQAPGSVHEIIITFEGSPIESTNPPWDGGFIWKKDINQKLVKLLLRIRGFIVPIVVKIYNCKLEITEEPNRSFSIPFYPPPITPNE